MPLISRHPSSYPLSEDIPALMISSTNNKLLAITVLQIQKKHISQMNIHIFIAYLKIEIILLIPQLLIKNLTG